MVGALARLGAIGAILSLGVALNMAQQDAPGAFACGAAGPYDFDTYEPEKYDQVYSRSIELATAGRAINGVYTVTSTAETVDLRFQGLSAFRNGSASWSPIARCLGMSAKRPNVS